MKRICNGCGGVVGRDCFNPVECEWISHSMDMEEAVERERKRNEAQQLAEQEQQYQRWCEKYHNNYPGSYYHPLFNYMADKHGLVLLQKDMDEVISIVNTMQAVGGVKI